MQERAPRWRPLGAEQVKLTRLESGRTANEEATLWRWDTAITPQLLTLDVVSPRRYR